MKKAIKATRSALCLAISVVMGCALFLQDTLPNKYYITEGQRFSLVSTGVFPVNAVYDGSLTEDAYASAGNTYTVGLRLPGGVSVKNVTVEVIDSESVVLGGTPFGIKMFTDGVLVVGITDIPTVDGTSCPARECGLREGDILHTIDGTAVWTNEDVSQIIADSKGAPLKVSFTRGDEKMTATIVAKRSTDGSYKAGLWVRDSSAGIGTMTYYDPDSGVFAGLGHAVCDVDTGEIMPLMSGEIVSAAITGVTRGESGSPGELHGVFLDSTDSGVLKVNRETGVYGYVLSVPNGKMVSVAAKQDITEGPAAILSTVSGSEPSEYNIVIEKINLSDKNPTKNMVIRVTDEKLLKVTGGIVQGMSGSPIIQNGKLVGAVTHVFINDPTRGYAIFAENMLETSSSLETP